MDGMLAKVKMVTIRGRSYALFSIIAGVVCVGLVGLVAFRYIHIARKALTPGIVYYVAPDGDDSQTGKSKAKPLKTIQKALGRAEPGDTVELGSGAYYQSVVSVRSGTEDSPITLRGTKDAVIFGNRSRVIEIHHDYLTLKGFQVNGHWSVGEAKENYRDKLIYVLGKQSKKGVEGLKLTGLLVQNAGGECIRLRYFARDNEVSRSTIRNCGVWDFRLNDGGKNGEGIYIGTAPEQRKDGKNPTTGPDMSMRNHIHHNLIETHGNECVDIKEGAVQNLIEYNTCRHQLDSQSGGFDARGNGNVFRYNTVEDTAGAAVRLGGDSDKDGIGNDVYGNVFRNNGKGPLNLQRSPQGKICGNSIGAQPDELDEYDGIDPSEPCD